MATTELVTMSAQELDRLGVIRRVLDRRLTQKKAGEIMGLSARQVRRLCAAYEAHGAPGRREGRYAAGADPRSSAFALIERASTTPRRRVLELTAHAPSGRAHLVPTAFT